jgi:hypothetical protein
MLCRFKEYGHSKIASEEGKCIVEQASTIISSIEFTFVAAVLLLHECWECLVEMVAGLAKLPRYQPVYEIQQDLSIRSEAARSRFDPGNRLS